MDFVDLIVAVHDQLAEHAIEHAFGGALALGYVAEPRGTVDIDVNVFLPADELERVTVALSSLGYQPPPTIDAAPIAGVRYRADGELFLSAEDLCVFKLPFGRPQDWVDLGKVAAARPELDLQHVEEQLIALGGPSMYPRLARFRGSFTRD